MGGRPGPLTADTVRTTGGPPARVCDGPKSPGTPRRRVHPHPPPSVVATCSPCRSYLPSLLNSDEMRSRFIWLMTSSGICLGQTAAHSPMLVQLPNPSASCWAIMPFTRR